MQKPTASNVALLAPVPLVHLIDGRKTAETKGKVAFGSRDSKVFKKLDLERKGLPVDVYIYASHGGDPGGIASWHALYIGQVGSSGGAHPADMRYRPSSTASDSNDSEIFWEVKDLRDHDRVSLAGLTGFGKKKAYGHGFVPRRPLLIEHP